MTSKEINAAWREVERRGESVRRAKDLLQDNTSEDQRRGALLSGEPWAKACGCVLEVRGGLTGYAYHVCAAGVVARLAAQGTQAFCVYAKGSQRDCGDMPDADSVLAIALYIQHDELHFLMHAAPRVFWMIERAEQALLRHPESRVLQTWANDGGRVADYRRLIIEPWMPHQP